MKVVVKIKNKNQVKTEPVFINTPFITLDSALKFMGIAETGGHAKDLIKEGLVKVNGKENDVIRKKLYEGDTFEIDGTIFEIKAEEKQ